MKDSFNDLSFEELVSKKDELSNKLKDLRFEMVMGHVENPLEKRNLRRKIARLNTLIHKQSAADEKA